MGSKTTQWLFEYAARNPFSGSVLELGVQGTTFDYKCLANVAEAANYHSEHLEAVISEATPHELVNDKHLFRAMGFSEVVRTDYDTFEGAEFTFDLNSGDGPPPEWRGRFDCVMDGGTMEHVSHTPNALKNIFEFLKVGGRIVHMSPSNNFLDHGFYSFSPTLFHDYYKENGFTVEICTLVEFTSDVEGAPWVMANYHPGELDFVQFGGLNDKIYATFFIATKTQASTFGRVPQQGLYRRIWAAGDQNAEYASAATRRLQLDESLGRSPKLQARLDRLAPYADRFAKWLRKPSQRRDFPLKDAKRY